MGSYASLMPTVYRWFLSLCVLFLVADLLSPSNRWDRVFPLWLWTIALMVMVVSCAVPLFVRSKRLERFFAGVVGTIGITRILTALTAYLVDGAEEVSLGALVRFILVWVIVTSLAAGVLSFRWVWNGYQ